MILYQWLMNDFLKTLSYTGSCVSANITPCAAFSKDCLLNDRWLLDGCPSKVTGIWCDVLKMSAAKQHIFIQRILWIHSLTKQKAGRAQILRVPSHVWDIECDVCCLAGHVLEMMRTHRTPDNHLRFTPEALKTVMTQFIEGILELDWMKYTLNHSQIGPFSLQRVGFHFKT